MGNYSHAKYIQYVILVHPTPLSEKKPKIPHMCIQHSAVMFSMAARISSFSIVICQGDYLFDNKLSAVISYMATNASVSIQL
jgi:hypothetical protein